MSAKAALYLAVREAGIRRATLARRLGISETEVRHMLDPRHSTTLSRIEAGLAALGKRLVVHTEAA
jgi:antitoxin HicB